MPHAAPVGTLGIAHGFVDSSKLSERARAAGGQQHDALVAALTQLIDDTGAKARAIRADADLTPKGVSSALLRLAAEHYTRLVATAKGVSSDFLGRIEAAAERLGSQRRLVANRFVPDPSTPQGPNLQDAVNLARRELLTMNGTRLRPILEAAFGLVDGEPVDMVTCLAVDSLPRFLRQRIELRAAIDLDELRARLLERENPQVAELLETVRELASAAHYAVMRSRQALADALRTSGHEVRMKAVEDALDGLTKRLSLAPDATVARAITD